MKNIYREFLYYFLHIFCKNAKQIFQNKMLNNEKSLLRIKNMPLNMH